MRLHFINQWKINKHSLNDRGFKMRFLSLELWEESYPWYIHWNIMFSLFNFSIQVITQWER